MGKQPASKLGRGPNHVCMGRGVILPMAYLEQYPFLLDQLDWLSFPEASREFVVKVPSR